MPLHYELPGTEAYIVEYVKESSSELGRRINETRLEMVKRHVSGGVLLDYGCGAGVFHQMCSNEFRAYGYDSNRYSGFSMLPHNDTVHGFDIVTMWDVIEHLDDPLKVVDCLRSEWLFLSTPNIEAAPDDVKSWKHYKPGEHIWYFGPKSLTASMACMGLECVEVNFDEGALRNPLHPEWIVSMAFVRVH